MKKIIAISLVVLFAVLLRAEAAELRIAHVDLQRALNESEAGTRAKEELKNEAKKLEDELSGKQEELKKLKEDIDKKGDLWNKETKEAKEKELQQKSQSFQKDYMQYGEELDKKKRLREEKIIKEIKETVRSVAKEKGYTYVLESSMGGILYAPQEADITGEVLKAYNKSQKD